MKIELTVTLNEEEMIEAIALYIRGKGYGALTKDVVIDYETPSAFCSIIYPQPKETNDENED